MVHETINTLTGLYQVDEGRIHLRWQTLNVKARRMEVAQVGIAHFQNIRLFGDVRCSERNGRAPCHAKGQGLRCHLPLRQPRREEPADRRPRPPNLLDYIGLPASAAGDKAAHLPMANSAASKSSRAGD